MSDKRMVFDFEGSFEINSHQSIPFESGFIIPGPISPEVKAGLRVVCNHHVQAINELPARKRVAKVANIFARRFPDHIDKLTKVNWAFREIRQVRKDLKKQAEARSVHVN